MERDSFLTTVEKETTDTRCHLARSLSLRGCWLSQQSQKNKCCCPHFTEVQTEALKSKVTCPRSHDSFIVGAARLELIWLSPEAALLGRVTPQPVSLGGDQPKRWQLRASEPGPRLLSRPLLPFLRTFFLQPTPCPAQQLPLPRSVFLSLGPWAIPSSYSSPPWSCPAQATLLPRPVRTPLTLSISGLQKPALHPLSPPSQPRPQGTRDYEVCTLAPTAQHNPWP